MSDGSDRGPLRVAVIGAGIGEQHVDAYMALPDRFRVGAVCDLDTDKAAALAGRVPGCIVSDDVQVLVSDPAYDVIDICLPPSLHGQTTLQALEAGKHVVCEKPLATSVAEAHAMAAAALDSGRVLMPVFQYRYGRAIAQLQAIVDRGLAGKPLVGTLETHWNRGADYYAVPWRGTWAGERGGAVLGHAIHAHDLATLVFGPATSVCSLLETRVNPIETEDCAAIAFNTESGALVTSSVTLGAATDTSRLRFVFDGLTVESGREAYAPGQSKWTFAARDPSRQHLIDELLATLRPNLATMPQGYVGQFTALSEAVAANSAPTDAPDDGVRSIEFVAAVYLSARTGTRVQLPLDRSLPICSNWIPT